MSTDNTKPSAPAETSGDDHSDLATNSTFEREENYLIVKIKDAQAYLNREERYIFESLLHKCNRGRLADHKPPLECVVVESDWPEYEPTWEAIEARMLNAENLRNYEPMSRSASVPSNHG